MIAVAEPPGSVAVNSEALQSEIAEGISRVREFAFLKEHAEKLGVRVWLFGGTAAGLGHYAKWNLQHKLGDPRYQSDRFDYDYGNIYRTTQDADIVIDGTAEQAEALETLLSERFQHLSGEKSIWEVRLLKGQRNDKLPLLNNPDFANQHTDSNSTGMIEVTTPPKNENRVRDLRDWNADASGRENTFLSDLRQGKLTYYFSDKHSSTSRAKEGMNPPILSAIRYLTKAFQFELELKETDVKKLAEVIRDFDPKSKMHPYVKKWIERNGKKLLKNAVNMEYAWDTLDKLGLRKKLIAVNNDANSKDSLAWWMDKEPLRSKPIGQGRGKTAGELGITTVAHETGIYSAFESITRAHTGDPNVFISRQGKEGESAVYGSGFYASIGRTGAKKTGLTIRFEMNPTARQGTDFEIHNGNYVRVLNRNAIRVIPESLDLGPVEYFQLLADQSRDPSDLGLLLRQRHRFDRQKSELTPEQMQAIHEVVAARLKPPHFDRGLLNEWNQLPKAKDYPSPFQSGSLGKKMFETVEKSQDGWNVEELKNLFLGTTTPDEFIQLMKIFRPGQYPDWDMLTNEVGEHFVKLKPSPEQFETYLNRFMVRTNNWMSLMKHAWDHGAISLDQYLSLSESYISTHRIRNNFGPEVLAILQESPRATQASPKEINRMVKMMETNKEKADFISSQLQKSSTPASFLDTLSQTYALSSLHKIGDTLDHFLSLNPTKEQKLQAISHSKLDPIFVEKMIRSTQTANEYQAIFHGILNQLGSYTESIRNGFRHDYMRDQTEQALLNSAKHFQRFGEADPQVPAQLAFRLKTIDEKEFTYRLTGHRPVSGHLASFFGSCVKTLKRISGESP